MLLRRVLYLLVLSTVSSTVRSFVTVSLQPNLRKLSPFDVIAKSHNLPMQSNKFDNTRCSSKTYLLVANTEDDSSSPSFSFNPIAGISWLALTVWAFSDFAPGSLGAPADLARLTEILSNPTHPTGVNELYYFVFNLFAITPIWLACLIHPQAQPRRGLPALPFIVASFAIGYFAIGLYLTFRAPPRDTVTSVSWSTKNVLENRLLSAGTIAFVVFIFFSVNVLGAYQNDAAQLGRGFVELITTSRFCAVSLVDLLLLYASAVALTPRDYLLRRPDATPSQARRVAAATAVVPFLGTAWYCATRPALPLSDTKDE